MADIIPYINGHSDALYDPGMYQQLKSVAGVLANSAFVPKHLIRESADRTIATCMLVASVAHRWGFDPFAVARESYEIGGNLGFQGKLIIAAVNTRAGLVGNLDFRFDGEGDNRTVHVIGRFPADESPRVVSLSLNKARTNNKMWLTDPDQKLCYSGAIRWARRHCPEVVMGVSSIEDLEAMSARPVESTTTRITTLDALTEKLAAPPPVNNGTLFDTTPDAQEM